MARANGQKTGQQLVPVRAEWCQPFSQGTSSLDEMCGFGNAIYAIKKDRPRQISPHCEWLCASLARAAGIPVPNFSIVETTAGEEWFGSEWINGEIRDWWPRTQRGDINIGDLLPTMSQILAFDLFIHNPDRNTGNYIVVKDGAQHKMFAFDHGHAWINNRFPFNGLMTDATRPTLTNLVVFKNSFSQFPNIDSMRSTLQCIDGITGDRVADIIGQHPTFWLKSAKKSAILKWWRSGQARHRVEAILQGLDNGKFG